MTEIDTESFRLRSFVERLVAAGECVVHDAPIELVESRKPILPRVWTPNIVARASFA